MNSVKYALSYFVSVISLDSTQRSCALRISCAFNLKNDPHSIVATKAVFKSKILNVKNLPVYNTV